MIKRFALLATLLMSSHVFAGTPDVVCVDSSEFRYEFSFRKNVSILISDDQGEALDELRDVEFLYRQGQTLPARDQLTFRSIKDGSDIAVVHFEVGEKSGDGELVESHTRIKCSR